MGRKATSKRINHAMSRRKVRRAENNRTDMPYRDKTIGQCAHRRYGGGVASGSVS